MNLSLAGTLNEAPERHGKNLLSMIESNICLVGTNAFVHLIDNKNISAPRYNFTKFIENTVKACKSLQILEAYKFNALLFALPFYMSIEASAHHVFW